MKNLVFRRLSRWGVALWRQRPVGPSEADPETLLAEKRIREAGTEHPVLNAVVRLAEEQYLTYLQEAVRVSATDAERARNAAEAGALLTFIVGVEEVRNGKAESGKQQAEMT